MWVQLQPYALKRTSNTRTRNDDTLSTHTAPTCHVVSSCVAQGNAGKPVAAVEAVIFEVSPRFLGVGSGAWSGDTPQ